MIARLSEQPEQDEFVGRIADVAVAAEKLMKATAIARMT